MQSKDAMSVQREVLRGEKPRKGSPAKKRVALHMEVEPEAREAFFRRARAAGLSGPDSFRDALAFPERVYDTDALRIAKPLADISYRLVRLADVVNRNELDAARWYVDEIRRIVVEAMRPLRSEHDEEVCRKTDAVKD